MQFQGRAVLFLVVIALFCGSMGTMLWIGPEHFSKLGFRAATMPSSSTADGPTIAKLEKTLRLLEKNYLQPVDRDKLLLGAIDGMVEAVDDPYTVYMNADQTKLFNEDIESKFSGIGAEVEEKDGKIRIVSPIKGSPAEKAGLRANDNILSVNGESLSGLNLMQAIKKIRGPKGTQAKLKIERVGFAEPLDYIVVRAEIPIETVYSKLLPDRIGKIEISQFSMNTAEHFDEQLLALEEQGMRGLIIDVRNNPGGLLQSVTQILENFVPSGEVLVQMQDREQEPEMLMSKGSEKPYPVVVLINEGSASASEILAAAMRETVGSKLVGVTTFGKGSVQNTFEKEMGDGSNLKVTVAQWLTPKGNKINKVGVKPDITVKKPEFYSVPVLNAKQTLAFDMVSDDVKHAQQMMKGIGYHKGRTDGYFDRVTESSVKAFQLEKGLEVSGKLDAKSIDALEDAMIAHIRDEKNDVQLKRAIEVMNGLLK